MPGGPIAADDLAIVSHVSPRAPGTTSGLVYLGHLVVEPAAMRPDGPIFATTRLPPSDGGAPGPPGR